MAGRDVPAASAALTADGTADGYITVADNTVFFKGAQAFMNNGGGSPVEVKIVDIAAANKIGIRAVTRTPLDRSFGPGLPQPSYGQSTAAAFTVAGSWKIFQPQQFIYGA